MSDLRNQLEAARSEYESLRYPGNLAADVLSRPRGRGMWWAAAAVTAISGLAAALFIATRTPGGQAPSSGGSVAMVATTQAVPAEQVAEASAPASLTFAFEGVSLAPSGEMLSLPSLPMVPSEAALNSIPVDHSTTQTTDTESMS